MDKLLLREVIRRLKSIIDYIDMENPGDDSIREIKSLITTLLRKYDTTS